MTRAPGVSWIKTPGARLNLPREEKVQVTVYAISTFAAAIWTVNVLAWRRNRTIVAAAESREPR